MSFVSHTGNNGVDYFIDTADGLTVLVPGTGAVHLDTEAVKDLVNFPRTFDYVKAVADYRRIGNSAGKPLTKFIETTGADSTKKLAVFKMLILDKAGRVVEATVSVLDVATGKVDSLINVSSSAMTKIIEELGKANVKADLRVFTDVKYVDSLPDETGLSSKKFYSIKGEVFKLNDAQDDFVKVEDPIVEASTLPATEVKADEKVLYFLTTSNKADYHKPGPDRGFYEYKKAKNAFVKADYVGLQEITRLPEADDVEDNMIYIVSKEIKQKEIGNIAKGTVYIGKEGQLSKRTALVVKEVEKLPSLEVAKEGTIYNVNNVLRKFEKGSFGKILAEGIEVLEEKPDFSKLSITVDPESIYILAKDVDETHKFGTKWVWDAETKSFKEYDAQEKAK